jgi:RNA polymerase-binding transcription factor DksA
VEIVPEAEPEVESEVESDVEAEPEPERERGVRPPSVLDRIQDDLDDVERSLARLDEGTYGTCQVCGTAIPDERLATEPTARFCAEHQAAPTD